MKIGKPSDMAAASITPAANRAAANAKAQSETGAASATRTSRSAETPGVAVTVSSKARGLTQVDMNAASDMDMDKVREVRSSIEQGTYKVNPEAIADKLLANANELLSRSRH